MNSDLRDTFRRALGDGIKQARQNTGLSQASFATKLGVSRAAVASWESGRQGMLIEQLLDIATELGVEFDDLVQEALDAASGDRVMPGLEDDATNKKRWIEALKNAQPSPGKELWEMALRQGHAAEPGEEDQ